MESVQLPKNLDLSQIKYSALKALESGGKNVYMSMDGKPILIQTPRMLCQWGLSKYNPDGKVGSEKYSIDMSFKDKETKPGVQIFFDKLMELDKKVVEDVTKNSKDWLRKANMTKEVVEALSTPSVKFAKDKDTGEITDKYPPSFRLNIPVRDGKTMCDVYDIKQNKLDLFDMDSKGSIKNSMITAIIKLQGLWFAGGKFGCTWRVEQLRIEPSESIKGFAFQPDDEDTLVDDDEEIDLGNDRGNAVETSDEDEDEDEDEDDDAPVENAKQAPASSKSAPPATPTVVEDGDEDDIDAPKVVVKSVAKKKSAK